MRATHLPSLAYAARLSTGAAVSLRVSAADVTYERTVRGRLWRRFAPEAPHAAVRRWWGKLRRGSGHYNLSPLSLSMVRICAVGVCPTSSDFGCVLRRSDHQKRSIFSSDNYKAELTAQEIK